MQQMLAASPRPSGRSYPAHRARTFQQPPDADQAAKLLAEMAAAPCAYSPVAADVPLAVYGAGKMGLLARDFLAAVDHKLVMVVDRDARRLAREPSWCSDSVLAPDAAVKFAKDGLRLLVCVVTAPYVPVERSLLQIGFQDIVPFYDLAENFRSVHPLSNGWFAAPLTASDREKTAEVLARWDDDISRAHHLQFLAWRRLREEWVFEAAPIPACARYFIPEVASVLNDKEFLLDAGAHDGSVTQAFAQQMNGAFRRIATIEPDAANRARLEHNLRSWWPSDPRVTVYDCALAEKEGDALFHDGLDYASQLSSTGRTRIVTRPLDTLELSPTFMKVHLEGGELSALKGAQATLLASRPIVAVTVYHNADGIWKTPHWLMQLLPDYRFLFRVHSWCGTGAVVYAIPNERCGR